MKRRNNRFLAGTLAGLMMLTMLPVTALAAEEGAESTSVAEETNGSFDTQENKDENISNVVNDAVSGTDGGSTEGGDTAGGTDGGSTEGGDTAGGADGGSTEGGDTAGGADGGSTEGGDTAGGAEGGSTEGGSTAGGAEGGSTEGGSTTDPEETFTAKIGSTEYASLSEAIDAAKSGDVIEVGEDITLDSGLSFDNKGELTIKGAGTPTITLNDYGMWLNKTNVKFQDIEIVENAITNPSPEHSGGTANLISNSNLTFDNASVTLNGSGDHKSGSGMYLYQESNLYVTNGSTFTISGFNGNRASGIFADNSEYDDMPNRDIEVTDGSSIIITDCDWHGMTVNPIDILIDDHSKIDISGCGNASYGGGLGCYYGGVTISDHSSLITDNNVGSGWGVFANGLSVDATSELSASGNTGHGAVLAAKSTIASGAKVTLTDNAKAGLRVYTGSNYWYGDVTIEDGAEFLSTGNLNGIEILPQGKLNMQGGTVEKNNSTAFGGGLYNRGGEAVIGGSAAIYNNHAATAGDDIYNVTYTNSDKNITYTPSLILSDVGANWTLDDCGDPIVGWYQDGETKRWNGDATDDSYYADEYTVSADAVSDTLALKAAHGLLCNVTYEVTGTVPSDAGAAPAAVKVKRGGSYTVAPAQTTALSGYTFSGWRIDGAGDIVTNLSDIQNDVKLVGVWTYTSGGGGSSGGGGGRRPSTVEIPDDVPTGLDGDDHFAYIVGYPDGNVKPSGSITRAEVATIFFRLLTEEVRTANSTQSNNLSDVSRGQWFNHAISTLSAMGIVKGKTDGSFDPDAPITRAEFAAIAARFDDKNTDTTSNFTDIMSHWAKNEIGIAANKGWINGYPDNTFRPDQNITRAEAMTLVNRVLNRLPETADDLHENMIKWPDNADKDAWFYLAVQEATNSHDYNSKSDADKYEKWTEIRDARDWTLLEK